LTCNAATYRFRDIRSRVAKIKAQNFGFGGSLESIVPKRGEDLSGTDMYHRATFHADRCHWRGDICKWTNSL